MTKDQSLIHAFRAEVDAELNAILAEEQTIADHIEHAHELGFWPDYELHHLAGRHYVAFRKDAPWERVRLNMVDSSVWYSVEHRGTQLIYLQSRSELTPAQVIHEFNKIWLPF